MRNLGALNSTDGPFDNILKIKPTIVFGVKAVDTDYRAGQCPIQYHNLHWVISNNL
jgi:NADPH:quinone reductase-like Zn-dependent oxidoreductase